MWYVKFGLGMPLWHATICIPLPPCQTPYITHEDFDFCIKEQRLLDYINEEIVNKTVDEMEGEAINEVVDAVNEVVDKMEINEVVDKMVNKMSSQNNVNAQQTFHEVYQSIALKTLGRYRDGMKLQRNKCNKKFANKYIVGDFVHIKIP
ncbi:7012_t:CDS:2 [Gigaspora rosea]|nr:7012_t:CDS:2 [Gigaspora rosea]